MNPIDSSKKWILNKLIPLIERQETKSIREEDLSRKEENKPNPSLSETSKENKNEQYSDLLEDSDYPKE